MASILKIDVLEQRYANSGIYLSGRIRGDQGDIINNGRLVLPGHFEANTFNVLESLDANTINANTFIKTREEFILRLAKRLILLFGGA